MRTRLTTALCLAVGLPAVFCLTRTAESGVRYSYDAAGRLLGADYGHGRVITYNYNVRGSLLDWRSSASNANPVADMAVSASAWPSHGTASARGA